MGPRGVNEIVLFLVTAAPNVFVEDLEATYSVCVAPSNCFFLYEAADRLGCAVLEQLIAAFMYFVLF